MSRLRSGPLAAWTSTWLIGGTGLDEVIDAVTGTDAPHQVGGFAEFDAEPVSLHEVLVAWRRAKTPVKVVLPVAGDVRGLPGPAAFRSAALEAGEAVCGGGIGLVPEVIEYGPSSAPPTVLWQAFTIDEPPPDQLGLTDAQYELTQAIRESASALSAADVAGWIDDIVDELHDARRAGEHLNLPPRYPSRAVALVAQAERLHAVLELAYRDPTGGAIDRTGIAARTDSLRPLTIAVRRARLAGYNALADEGTSG
ncbi:MAG: hypothetical protein ACRDWT_03385 [Jatrophihabitantaceae bacterium]